MSRIKQGSVISTSFALLVFACGPSTTTPATPAPGTDPYAAYYPPPACDPSQPGCVPGAQPAYPAQPGYPAQPYPAQPGYPAQPYPAQPAAPASTMAVPGALALPCQSDSSCLMGRCNVQYQKCAFPCQSAADCATGAACNTMSGLCLPGRLSSARLRGG
jgi:hypothetical protein